jgi:hypothetical protein
MGVQLALALLRRRRFLARGVEMASTNANAKVIRSGSSLTITFVATVIVLIAFNAAIKWIIPHLSPREEWAAALMFGGWASEAMVFGAWAALGFGVMAGRLLIVVPCLLLLYVVPELIPVDYVPVERIEFIVIAITAILIFAGSILLFSTVRWLTGSRIEPPPDARAEYQPPIRFSTKYLFGTMFLYALLFGLFGLASQTQARAAPVAPAEIKFGPSVHFAVNSIRSAFISVALLPTLAVPVFVLRGFAARRAAGAAVAVWLFVTAVATVGFAHAESDSPLEVVAYLILMQLGAAVVGLLGALPLRWAGCRLIRGVRES